MAISLRLESVIRRVHACCVLVTKLCVRTFRSLCHCDELLFLTKDSSLEFGSFGSSFKFHWKSLIIIAVALSRCRFKKNKKLRLHAIILFAFARLKYIHTRTHARTRTNRTQHIQLFLRASAQNASWFFLKEKKKKTSFIKKGTVDVAKTTVWNAKRQKWWRKHQHFISRSSSSF
jgi:hypothetical protein